MKANCLNRIETLTAALLLALVLGCGESKPPAPEPKAATPPPAAAATPAAAPAPTPAAPAAPAAETPSAAAPASGAMRYDAASTGSKMKIEGTSNIHDWNMESAVVGGFLEADAKFPEATGGAVKAEVFMPVRSFKSTSKVMDNKMQVTMKEPQFKSIQYKLIELKPKSGAQFDAVGALTIAGQTRTNTMPVTIQKAEGDKLKVTGTAEMKMTEYGVEPPTLTIAGVGLKTGDDIKLSFEWLLAPKAKE